MKTPPPTQDQLAAIATRLKHIRKALGYENQSGFCDALGIPRNTWNQYETGKSRPALEVAFKLKDKFGISLDYLYCGDPAGLPVQLNKVINNYSTE